MRHPLLAIAAVITLALAGVSQAAGLAAPAAYLDSAQPNDRRVGDLVTRLSLPEKSALLGAGSPGVPRLQIAPYVWWNECLHGVARSGEATVFPQAIGLAAMWDENYLHTIADTISTEGRAKYHEAIRRDQHLQYYGLTFWSPNINIARDPRWGRDQETYGEDPFLTSRMGVAFVKGIQGDNPNYLKAAACAKHFAVHSGPERLRREINNAPTEEDFYDTYLPAFEALVREAHVAGVMTAYNSLYGQPCTVSPVLYDLLKQWDFKGYVVSDCGAVQDLYRGYKVAADPAEAEAMAVKLGLCITCGREAPALVEAVQRGLIDEKTIDQRLAQALTIQFRLGMFDPPEKVPYAAIPFSENGSIAHSHLALEAARKSIVLLKNDGTLPLDPAKLKRIAVIGPNARSVTALLGNYAGTPRFPVTILAGLRAALSDVQIEAVQGCAYIDGPAGDFKTTVEDPAQGFETAVAAAKRADVVLYVGGLSADLEGEAANNGYEDFDGRDRTRIELPPPQQKMIEALHATGKPVIYINMSGGAVAFPWAAEHLNAIIQAWYPGENGGTAVADVLLGKVNPAGRLPVTFYRSTTDLPEFTDYAMKNRTYRFFTGTPLYPFGHGLSYTSFRYDNLKVQPGLGLTVAQVTLDVTNTGSRAGDEVVQLYAKAPASSTPRDRESLCGYQRIAFAPGETKTVSLNVTFTALRRWDVTKHDYSVPAGFWTICAGASSADLRLTQSIMLGPTPNPTH